MKPTRTDIIEQVDVHLHESFQNPHVTCEKPPYSFHGRGWGYFNIDVRVRLKFGYAWLSKHTQSWPDGSPQASLKLSWVLDFESDNGRGSMGRCRVGVGRALDRPAGLEELQNLSLQSRASAVDAENDPGREATRGESRPLSNAIKTQSRRLLSGERQDDSQDRTEQADELDDEHDTIT